MKPIQMILSDTENVIIDAMARAFYVMAWADVQQEKGKSFPGQDLMDLAPETPRYARDFALMFAGRFVERNKESSNSLLVALNNAAWADVLQAENLKAEDVPFRFQRPDLEEKVEVLKDDKYASDFGHYIAMQALGHGVSWFDDHAQFDLKVPYTEFYID